MDYQKTQSPEGQPTNPNQITPEQGIYSAPPEANPNAQDLRSVGNLVNKTTIVPETPRFEAPATPGIPEIPHTPETTPETIPETALEPSPGTTPDNLGQITDTPEGLPIIPPETSPAGPIETPTPTNQSGQSNQQHTYKRENIRVANDRLTEATITEISNLEEKLNQDGDMASFYDNIRDAMESNLANSYNRKLGA